MEPTVVHVGPEQAGERLDRLLERAEDALPEDAPNDAKVPTYRELLGDQLEGLKPEAFALLLDPHDKKPHDLVDRSDDQEGDRLWAAETSLFDSRAAARRTAGTARPPARTR